MMKVTEYGTASVPWDLKSGFGNHRFIVKSEKNEYARAVLPWRRRDAFFDRTCILIRYSGDGKVGSTVGENGIYDYYFENRFVDHNIYLDLEEQILAFFLQYIKKTTILTINKIMPNAINK